MELQVEPSQISPSNFNIGDQIGCANGEQYLIVDFVDGMFVLRKLFEDEHIKRSTLQGWVEL